MREEFNITIEGREINYVYDFEQMKAEQMIICQELWELYNQQRITPPTNVNELSSSYAMKVKQRAYMAMLSRYDHQGNQLEQIIDEWIKHLKYFTAEDLARLEACRENFCEALALQRIDLLQRYSQSQRVVEASSTLQQQLMTHATEMTSQLITKMFDPKFIKAVQTQKKSAKP